MRQFCLLSSRYMHTLQFYLHATVSADLFSLEGLYRPTSSSLIMTLVGYFAQHHVHCSFTLTHHLCVAVPFPRLLVPISHFPFPVPTFRVTYRTRNSVPYGGPVVHSDVASAAGPPVFRIMSAMFPQSFRTISAASPQCYRLEA